MIVNYSNTSSKQLKKLSRLRQIEVLKKIEQLKNNPLAGKKLKGSFEIFRSLKVWPYRIIYQYFENGKMIFINVIEHRQS
ncbi:MAG: type II toxin-antitoxin system RelE/ParE family toxin, partial [Actinobacteria bacterium]|nr:type II toxin-antitoxin system RelE/ParE family toxin [Actinomycetota bacterium]